MRQNFSQALLVSLDNPVLYAGLWGMSLPFHPLVNSWFAGTYRKATAIQEEAWPLIARGEHVLALAPTGSGKTLTAFLGAIPVR
ncbi:MAG: DEAD/DEAH box helicase [Treponema sp.]|jgi:superfamily II DNA helicase RecQ|nr:DEAD/DEAH box helicase [Treponema sp.]